MRAFGPLSCAALAAVSAPAAAQTRGALSADDMRETASDKDIVVTGARLDAAREHIQPSLGASNYEITSDTIKALPGGEN